VGNKVTVIKVCKALILMIFPLISPPAFADNVPMVETTKFLAPETVNMHMQYAPADGFSNLQVREKVKCVGKRALEDRLITTRKCDLQLGHFVNYLYAMGTGLRGV